MNPSRHTQLLSVLVAISLAAAAISWSRLSKLKDDAIAAEADLRECRVYLADLHPSSGAATASLGASQDISDLNRRIQEAAKASGAASKLTGIEPGQTARVANTDYNETMLFLHFEPLTIKELIVFLQGLSEKNHEVRSKMIELETPQGQEQTQLWTADVTVGYLAYSAQDRR